MRPSKLIRLPVGVLAITCLIAAVEVGCSRKFDDFGIYTSRLDGSDCKLICSDSWREMNHVRLSPDKKWITFTRYNHKGWEGTAREEVSYAESEIMLARSDGSEMRAIVPAKSGLGNANSTFTPDGKSIIFVSTDHSDGRGHERLVDIAGGKSSFVEPDPAIPQAVNLADPHQVGDKIVITAVVTVDGKPLNQLWLMNADGSGARKLTDPRSYIAAVGHDSLAAGDYDPRISADGKKVAFMRHVGPEQFDVIVIDLGTGEEKDISAPVTRKGVCDALPAWSSDGKLLAFWHITTKDVPQSGIWTMTPEGKDRRRVPLPKGFWYTMPAFFPGEGSDSSSHIIFSGHRQAGM